MALRRAGAFLAPIAFNPRPASRTPQIGPIRAQASASGSKPRRRRADKSSKGELSNVGVLRPLINWYPGHIAKAERALMDSLRAVDVVVEVRDARAPGATSHPRVPAWVGERRTHIVALGKADLASDAVRRDWKQHLRTGGPAVRFVDAKRGRGVRELKKLAVAAGADINAKRRAKGLLARPVRTLVVGYPNVGKSALINRLVKRKAARSANTPGVTRNFQWVRIDRDLDLLDMPGIIPMKIEDQDVALRLVMCDDIGHASYDRQIAAAKMVDELKRVSAMSKEYFDIDMLRKRYDVDASEISGEEWLHRAAQKCHHGDMERIANRLFVEFRSGDLGPVGLEPPPGHFAALTN